MRNPVFAYNPVFAQAKTFSTSKNKGADQLRGNHAANQRLCFSYIDSTIPLLSKSKITSIYLSIYLPIRLNPRRGHQTGSGEPSVGVS